MNTYLVVRTSDQLMLGIGWVGMTTSVDAAGQAVLTATTEKSLLVVTFAPQHLAEETSAPGSEAPLKLPSGSGPGTVPAWRSFLAGPSRLAVAIATGVTIPLTVAGILKALREGVVAAEGQNGTRLELPARLFVAPVVEGAVVKCVHGIEPGTSDGVTGLWRTRIRNSVAPTIGLHAVGSLAADPLVGGSSVPLNIPLTSVQREKIVGQSPTRPAMSTRLELSGLGGSLDAFGQWPTFDWEHHCVLGRDMSVRTVLSGALYPLGNRALLQDFTTRDFDRSAGGAAVLRTIRVLTVTEPVREQAPDARTRKQFPFRRVELRNTTFTNVERTVPERFPDGATTTFGTHHWLRDIDGKRIEFAIRASTSTGTVDFTLPLVFVIDHRPAFDSLNSQPLAVRLAKFYGSVPVSLPSVPIDLVGAEIPLEGDVHEVRGLTIAGSPAAPNVTRGYRPTCAQLLVALPALRVLLNTDSPQPMEFVESFLSGASSDVPLKIAGDTTVSLDFTSKADRSGGLVAPRSVANAISRTTGPIDQGLRPEKLFADGANLLGFPLRLLLADLNAPPQITSALASGGAPEVKMIWKGARLKSQPGFEATNATLLNLTVLQGPASSTTDCTIASFALSFPPVKPVLRLSIDSLRYLQTNGQPPDLTLTGPGLTFSGALRFIEDFKKALDSFGGAAKLVSISPSAVSVRYRLAAPPITSGAFVLTGIAFNAGITVPFQDSPSITLGFSSRALPFQLSVLLFGGTGYVAIELNKDGIKTFDAALEFGALVNIDFLIASGEVHALGGVRFELQANKSVSISGYLRIGGSVQVLGLVSVSIELIIALTYRSNTNALVGRATLVIVIDLTLWSDRMELDSGEWTFAGNRPRRLLDSVSGFQRWQQYRRAFVPEQADELAAVELDYEVQV